MSDADALDDEAASPEPVDLRTVGADEPAPHESDKPRVPPADETADTITRAQRALVEIRRREHVDADHAADENREADLARWHADDEATHDEAGRDRDADVPVLEPAGP